MIKRENLQGTCSDCKLKMPCGLCHPEYGDSIIRWKKCIDCTPALLKRTLHFKKYEWTIRRVSPCAAWSA
jgi:hypothetical protein